MRIPKKINFDEIYLNKHETIAKNKITESRSRFFWKRLCKLLSKLSDEHNTRESILTQTSPSNENMIGLKNLSTRNVIRKLYDVKRSHSGSRINLSSVGGKDTDPNHTYEIL